MLLLKILERVPKGYIIRDQFTIAEDVPPDFVEVPTRWNAKDEKALRRYRKILSTAEAYYYVASDLKPEGDLATA